MALLFANQTENDILCRNELEQFSQDSRFKVSYTLDRPEEGWTGQTGFINDEMIKTCLPGPSDQGSAKYVMKNKQLNKNSGVLGFFVLKTGDGHMRIKSGVL